MHKEVIKLEELFEIFESFYPKESFNIYSSLKNLLDLSGIEKEPDPIMIKKIQWEEARDEVYTKIANNLKTSLN